MSDGVESDADDEGLGFDPFEDDGFDDWSDDGSDDWSEEEDDEERKGGRGWRWSSGKSETRVRLARPSSVKTLPESCPPVSSQGIILNSEA